MVLHLECLATMLAHMRALVAMGAPVSVDGAQVREGSVTALEVTLEWAVTSMVAFVQSQATGCWERAIANWAHVTVIPFVLSNMTFKGSFTEESFPASFTFVHFLRY